MQSLLLSPAGPFSEVPRSDTLFGAICWGIRFAHGEDSLEDVLAGFKDGDPPFLISSAFPTLTRDDQNGDRIRFLPKPRLPSLQAGGSEMTDEQLTALGVWKQIEYVPSSVFSTIVTGGVSNGELLDRFEDTDTNDGAITIGNHRYDFKRQFLLPTGMEQPYEKTERTRNAVNRLTNATDGSLYHRDAVFFPDDAGLHVCFEGDIDTVLTGFSMLQDHGIGGDRSVGHGQFSLEGIETVERPAPDSDLFCSLSLCIPRDEEMDDFLTEGYYELEPRKGVVENSLTSPESIWKKRVLALAEGSVLPRRRNRGSHVREGNESGFYGYNPIVADHFDGIQHYGYSLPVGVCREAVDGQHGDPK